MALMIPIQLPETGATAAYWRLTHLALDRGAGVLEALLHGYLDEAARREGRQPLGRIALRFEEPTGDSPDVIRLADIYRAIRARAAEEAETENPLRPFREAKDI